VHDCRGGCGSGLYAHPPKRDAGQNGCEESNPNSVGVSESETNGDEQDGCDAGGRLGNATTAEKLEDHPEEQTSKEHLLHDWAG
jgi:hypothetical protein